MDRTRALRTRRLAAFTTSALFVIPVAMPATARAVDFVRGDARPSGAIDLSDAITIFQFLFLGGPRPVCLDAADANDDGVVDISDGIADLRWLFGGGAAPPPPSPSMPSYSPRDCGPDLTRDPLGCVEFSPCPPTDPDPLGLEELVDIMSAATPPTGIVPIVRQIPGMAAPATVMTVRFMGAGELVEREATEPMEDPSSGTPEPSEPPVERTPIGRLEFCVFNTASLREFEVVVIGELLELIHDAREASGETSASEGVEDPIAVEGGRGGGADLEGDGGGAARSDGVDTRTIRTPTTTWPWRAICHFDNNCTGTLIGPRHVITAAHCINQVGTNTWYSFNVRPGRDGNTIPYGTSSINPNPMPGDPFRWYFTPAPWRNPATTNTRQWDWGLIIIPDRLGEMTSWMGYVARPSSDLNAVSNYNRGYPACGLARPDVPVGCQAARLYGDSATCNPGAYSSQGGNGWNRIIDHRCDTGGGQSGSPVYHYFFDPQLGMSVPVVSMVHVASPFCDFNFATPCMAQHDFPSRSRRIEPDALATISFFRETYP